MHAILDQKEIYSNFIDSLKSPQTKKTYACYLRLFMQFHRIEVRKKFEESDFAALFINPEQKIKSYLISCSKKDYAKSHFTITMCALKNFYEMNDIDTIHWNKLRRFIGETKPQHEDRAYRDDEILTMVNGAGSLKMKAICLLMASSGIRIGSIPNLRVSHLQKKGDLYRISVYEGEKGKGHYSTYCTPEAAKAIDSYLDFRRRCGERINPDSPLFRMDFDTKFIEEARNRVKPVTLVSVRTNLHRLLVRMGLRELDPVSFSRKDVKMSHGFRKFFVTQLVNAGVHDIIIKKLSGHKLDRDMTYVYSKQSEEELISAYEMAIDKLTINPENKLRRKVQKLEVEKTQFERLAAEIESLKKKIK